MAVANAKRCPWCDGRGTYPFSDGSRRPCNHPRPVVIRALPDAEFRVTKYEVASGESRLRKPTLTFQPPKGGAYAAFRKACEATGYKLTIRMAGGGR